MSDNQVEASKALGLARKYDDQGDLSNAVKWCKKSIAIHSTPEAAALLTRLETRGVDGVKSSGTSTTSTSAGAANGSARGLKNRASSATSPMATEKKPKRAYTEEQAAVVSRIKRSGGDFYKVLSVEKTVDDNGIKKAYRKVSTLNSKCFTSKF